MIVRVMVLMALAAAPMAARAAEQPYEGLEAREIKALSPEEIAALEAGLGFSQALPAELNGYPGPRHVIDLAHELDLTPAQRAAVEEMFAGMQAEAIAAGRAVLDAEAALEAAFRGGALSEDDLAAMAEEIGRLRGVLRGIHLRYHLRTKALLSPHQVAVYNAARGYGGGQAGHGGHMGHAPQ
jgi:Spy/CpxP family protein refolding chaperone